MIRVFFTVGSFSQFRLIQTEEFGQIFLALNPAYFLKIFNSVHICGVIFQCVQIHLVINSEEMVEIFSPDCFIIVDPWPTRGRS